MARSCPCAILSTMPFQRKPDRDLLEAALIGLQQQHSELARRIAELQSMLNGRAPKTSETSAPTVQRKRHKRSAATRKRMAEAQRKRWAKVRAKPGARR